MTFEEWWENNSGWGGELLSERALAKSAWNEAIDQAKRECKKSAKRAHGVGARDCFEIHNAIDDLRVV